MLTGPNRKGSVVRGDLFVVDEDTELLDRILQNGDQRKQSRNGGNQKETSSKNLEENITTEKKLDSNGRTAVLFPGKPTDDIIDLDTADTAKKPSSVFPGPSKIPSLPRTPADAEETKEQTESQTRTNVLISVSELDAEKPSMVTIISVEQDLVRSSDGKMYRLKRGPPGPAGDPGPEVSGLRILFLP